MGCVGVLIVSMLLCAEGAIAQGTVGAGTSLAGENSRALQNLKNTLSPEQRTAINDLGRYKPAQSKVCPNCVNVDDSQMVFHAFVNPEPAPGAQHILVPIAEQNRLEDINATLWKTLNLLKGADKEYMNHYLADEKVNAPTTLDQIALRSEYINNLVSKLGK